ncbi:hypothetical protein [Pseudonocardia spinosispora]|uniref:hypothetical protein n=1 Tax=Pseudonocardia spinosispora TaxID=103441 RepID=UPI000415E7CB|nr:hypothetical protein [Pseudonocardia spinosispora]
MKPYAEIASVRGRQLMLDGLVVVWLLVFLLLAVHANDLVSALRTPTTALINTGANIAAMFAEGAAAAAQLPFFGSALSAALQQGQAAGEALRGVGQQQDDAVSALATGTALLVMLIGLLPPLLLWLPSRLRYAKAAGAAALAREDAHALDLLALRALTTLPPAELRIVGDHPANAWRTGDPEALRQLAALELRRLGLHPPTP